VDLSVLPNIFSLAVFIVGFRPLVRRVGSHVNLWFLGWFFILIQQVALLFPGSAGLHASVTAITILWAQELAGIAFMAASANEKSPLLEPMLLLEMGVPVLLRTAVMTFYPRQTLLEWAVCVLFLVPGFHLLVMPRLRHSPAIVVAWSFALAGVVGCPAIIHNPRLLPTVSLTLVYLSAAYLLATCCERTTRGTVAAIIGLAGWGLSFPLVALVGHLNPNIAIDRDLLDMPKYLVVAGMILTLLEAHVERTERMAMHDPLTDLPNRRLFEERLVETMEEARRNRTTVACLVIDVDNFKTINDTMGHDVGDQLLRALAVRLSWHMSPRDILARTGGDEFTALLAGVNDEHHLRFIASAMMSAASVPVMVEGGSVDVRISVGIALSPDDADDINDLRRMADEAMYSAKRRGGSLLAFAGEV
jgi:diguanylate cyclase (GGDEF)-like protein